MLFPNGGADIGIREITREFLSGATIVLTLSISYPQIRLPGGRPYVQNRINRSYRRQASEFNQYAETTLYRQAVQELLDSQQNGFPFRPYDAVMKYESTFNRDCHLSGYSDRYEYTGGAHGNTSRTSDTWNLQTGEPLPLSAFFPPGTDVKSIVLEQIQQQAKQNMQQQPGIYFENYPELIDQYFDPESYFLTPDGINIYYQQYEIAPYSTGIVVFTLPYGSLVLSPRCFWVSDAT